MAALSALRTDFQRRFQDKNAGFLSATPANLYLNIACEEFQNDVQPIWREYGYYVTAKQFRYDLPSDHIHTFAVMWYQQGQFQPIEYLSPQEFKDRGYLNKRYTVSTPEAYTMMDNDLYLGPAPGSSSNTSTLNGAHNTTVTTISVADGTKFNSPSGIVKINSEQIAYQNVSTNDLTLAIRAQGGTSAASHSNSDTVSRLDLVITYAFSHAYMSADTDTPAFSARYHRLPIHYAMYLALKQDSRDEQAKEEYEVYMLEKQKAKAEIRRLSRDRRNRKIATAY